MATKRRAKAKPVRPSLFVGSSSESLDVAYAIQENLQHDAEVTVWPQGVFELSRAALESLKRILDRSDFGVFVFTPNDRVRLRKKSYSAVRDNVVFELGLFSGKLGPERTFIVIPDETTDLRIPTDLTGVTPGRYQAKRKDGNLVAALGPFCNQVRRALKKRGAVRKRSRARQARASLRAVTIHSARYGTGTHRYDVKRPLLAELRRAGTAYVGNQLLGDPAPNTPKDLILDFSYRGQRQKVVIPENSSLEFPK